MKDRKGFTLIELLAVVVILSIIMVIAIPKVLDVIEQTDMAAYKSSVELMVRTAKLQYRQHEVYNDAEKIPDEGLIYEYTSQGNNTMQTSESINKYGELKFKGDKPSSGTLILTKEIKVSVNDLVSKNKKWCAQKEEGESNVRVGRATSMGCSVDGGEEIVQDKKPCELEVDSKDSNILYADSASDIYQFSIDVNAGNTYEGKTIKIRNNLDMSSASGTCVNDFEPIGTWEHPFMGTFDGGGKTLSNLTINKPSNDQVALFGYTAGGTIKGLNFDNITMVGRNKVAAIVGQDSGTTIKMITLKNINITGYNEVASVAGFNGYGTLNNIIVKGGKLTADEGLATFSTWTGPSASIVEDLTLKGAGCGITWGNGVISSSSLDITECASANTDYDKFPASDKGDLNFYEAFGLDTYIGGDNDNDGYYWDYDGSEVVVKSTSKDPIPASPEGSLEKKGDYYLIKNESDWKKVTGFPANTSKYKLTSDLNFSNKKFYMMGSEQNYFEGKIYAETKTISNVTINASRADCIGIFGHMNTGRISGLNVDNINITGKSSVGAIVGVNGGANISSIVLRNINIKGETQVASVSGYNGYGTINNIIIKSGNVTSNDSLGIFTNWTPPASSVVEDLTIKGNGCGIGGNNVHASASMVNNCNGITNGTIFFPTTDKGDINYYEANYMDTYIGGDNDGDGYYLDYSGNEVVIKSVSQDPIPSSPEGTLDKSGDYYLIKNESDWKKVTGFASDTSKYKLTSDLDFSNHKFYMLGSYPNKFRGQLYGEAKTISNITIHASKADYIGMIGESSGAKVYGLNLENFNITGKDKVGGAFGAPSNTEVKVISLKNMNITGNTEVGPMDGAYMSWVTMRNILVKSGTITANVSAYIISGGNVDDSLVENVTLKASGCGFTNGYGNNHYSNSIDLQCDEATTHNTFASSNVGNISYYADKVNKNVNATPYRFDYVASKNGIYVVK